MNIQPLKGKMPVYIALLALVLAAMWLLYRCSHNHEGVANEFAHPSGDTLVVAIEMSPMSYAYSGDTVTGFDYEMIREICRIHHVPVVFQPFAPYKYAFEGMKEGKFDMIVASMPATKDLKEMYPLTGPVYLDRQVLVQKIGRDGKPGVNSQLQLIGDTVWIAANSPYITRLRNMSKELGDSVYVMSDPQYSSEHLCILTSLGKIPRAVVNEGIARRMSRKYNNLEYSTPISFNQFQCWAVNPRYPELLDSLDSWIKSFKATPAYQSLTEKYL